MAQRGDVEEYNVLKGNIVMGKDGKVIRSENAFFDLIAKMKDLKELFMMQKS